MDLYDKNQNVIGTVIFDAEDIPKVKYTRWKISGSGYAVSDIKFNNVNANIYFHERVLGIDCPVEHANHNILDNRKQNLRPIINNQGQPNTLHKGVCKRPDGRFMAYIKVNQKKINLGIHIDEADALWARWYAERVLFGECAYHKEEPVISETRKESLKAYVDAKVQRL